MGYYTRHELTVINGDEKTDYEQEIADITGGYDRNSLWKESVKWYDCEKHMIKYSKKHPNVTFLIYGEGEESTDIWKAYFKNGKTFTTKAKLVFEEYSDDKLE